jgi:CheY-like chemotaxis protein
MDRSAMSSDVVVVDDDPRVRTLVVRTFEREGLRTRGYGAPLAALDLVLAHPPAVLVSDLEMPELDGVALAAAVRGGLGERSPRILLLTGNPRAIRAKDKHLFDLILAKPWDRTVILNAILPWVRASIPPPLAVAG